ncbi:hypothetical protein Ciccas_006670 [Cichlidogyrus casuarinus]|uniref:Uncharacterized protein n=1 Tax=Cichlidogyrus casuarinus TaxID=1844966 RepID=A0ABD2Q5A6_9PLAT
MASEYSANGLSATVVRRALSRGQSVRYLVPDAALEEIYASGLYGSKNRHQMLANGEFEMQPFVHSPPVPPQSSEFTTKHNRGRSEFQSSEAIKHELQLNTASGTICIPVTINISKNGLGGVPQFASSTGTHVDKTVQTRLTALPKMQAPLALRRIKSQVLLDPEIGLHSAGSAFDARGIGQRIGVMEEVLDSSLRPAEETDASATAILPLIRQCHRCGSQRVRLILVERPSTLPDESTRQRSTMHKTEDKKLSKGSDVSQRASSKLRSRQISVDTQLEEPMRYRQPLSAPRMMEPSKSGAVHYTQDIDRNILNSIITPESLSTLMQDHKKSLQARDLAYKYVSNQLFISVLS